MSSTHTHTTFSSSGIPQPYHLVRPSVWPLIGAFSGALFVIGMILYMHDIPVFGVHLGIGSVVIGVLAILFTMFHWWKDVLHEAVVEKVHTPIAQIGLRYGMALFIASEVMFFVAFFWAFFDASLFPHDVKQVLRMVYTKGVWPPPQIHVTEPWGMPFLMTMILLLSGCTVTWAHAEILKNNRKEIVRALKLTAFLGVCFLGFQSFEYAHTLFHFTGGVYPSTFYMATGFHGFHVLVGTVFLIVCTLRAIKGQFTPDRHFGFEAAAWYWHFVDVIWLFLFIAIYFWGNTIGIGHSG